MLINGGCLCGKLRYQSKFSSTEKGYCHCSICRKSTSAPVVAFTSFPIEGFSYVKGKPSIYKSSEKGQREFCYNCGTQIAHRRIHDPETVDVNSGTLDDLTLFNPDFHIYTEEQVPWLNIADNLPRYKKGCA